MVGGFGVDPGPQGRVDIVDGPGVVVVGVVCPYPPDARQDTPHRLELSSWWFPAPFPVPAVPFALPFPSRLQANKKCFEVPLGYTGNLLNDQKRCDDFCNVIVDDRRKSSEIHRSPANRALAEAFEKWTGQKFSKEQRGVLRVCGSDMEKERQ